MESGKSIISRSTSGLLFLSVENVFKSPKLSVVVVVSNVPKKARAFPSRWTINVIIDLTRYEYWIKTFAALFQVFDCSSRIKYS